MADNYGTFVRNTDKSWDAADEKAPFLRNEPVKLTPAWEGNNLPNDTLNLKGIAMDLAAPKDKWNIIFLTLMLHGLGTLTAWNMFITAKDYFVNYKLKTTVYANQYLAYVGWASQIPNLLFSWFNVFYQTSGNLTVRIVWSLVIEVVIFVITIILAMLDTSNWPGGFFWITMISVFFLNGFNSIFQNSVFGVAARLPPKYTGAVVMGSNFCGLLVVGLSWLSVLIENPRTAAIYYFIGGMFVLLICIDTYFALPLNKFFRYHDQLHQNRNKDNTNKPINAPQTSRFTLFKQAFVQLYNVFIIFFVTLSVFPAVISDVTPNVEGFLGTNFMRITCYLTFNLTATIGNITASTWQFPGPRLLVVFTTLRLLFIPFFLLCNYKTADRTLPVLVTNDWVFWIACVIMGWSSGHGSSLAMMYIGGTVAPENTSLAGMIGGAVLVTGIMAGITFTWLCPIIVTAGFWKTA